MKHRFDPTGRNGWTKEDDAENERRIQRTKDHEFWGWAARRLRMPKRDLLGLLTRFIDDRFDAAFARHLPALGSHFEDQATADAVRSALVDLIADDLIQMIQILTSQGATHDAGNASETA